MKTERTVSLYESFLAIITSPAVQAFHTFGIKRGRSKLNRKKGLVQLVQRMLPAPYPQAIVASLAGEPVARCDFTACKCEALH